MIAKRVPRTASKSSYRALAEYILDLKDEGEKVLYSWSSGCGAGEDLELCITEIVATQELNTRSKNDKSYHLVISLAEGEELSEAQFKEIENHLCEAIGLGEHSRICAVHGDTDHRHMHLAISKIHPVSLNCVEPYYDKHKLQDACRELEKQFGLKAGISGEKARQKTPLSELYRGVEAFESFVRTNLREELIGLMKIPGTTWDDAQALAGKFGLEIREHGAGLVFSDVDRKLFTRVSNIDRSFSKMKFEKTLGKFKPQNIRVKAEKRYEARPTNERKGGELFAKYSAENQRVRESRKSLLSRDREVKYNRIQDIKSRYARRRSEVKSDTLMSKQQKRAVFTALAGEMKKELAACFSQSKDSRTKILADHKTSGWLEWLRDKASGGNETALEILRDKLSKTEELKEQSKLFGSKEDHSLLTGLPRKIGRTGVVEYKTGGGEFLDYGKEIVVKSASEETVKAALHAAFAKFGNDFEVNGNKEFLAMVDRLMPPEMKKEMGQERTKNIKKTLELGT